jgi:HSP20 family protein
MMAKGSVRVSKSKASTPVKGEDGRASPESFGQLFEPLASVRRDIDRFFERLAPDFPRGIGFDPFRRMSSAFELGGSEMVPHVEVSEDKKAYEITAELPGVEEKDVNLSLQDDVLTLSGEKKSEHEEKKEGYHMSERSYGSFRRSFRLPDDVNADRISAKFDKGVMTITLPRVAGAKLKGRNIPIK